jgi:NTP pyrophosphatase (non-canonical NTP hydrolase)
MINKIAEQIYQNAKAKGFYEGQENGSKNIAEMLALIHSEVSEALECDRNEKYFVSKYNLSTLMALSNKAFNELFAQEVKDTFEDELADVMIRVMDLAAYKGIDLETHIAAKMRFNSLREYKHGKKY